MQIKKGTIPLYYQLEAILRKRILTGQISDDNAFPSEQQLCQEFSVSRITVRQALAILEDENLIKREQGRGTFVLKNREHKASFNAFGYVDDLIFIAEQTQLKLFSKNLYRVDEQLSKEMGIIFGDEVWHITGIRELLCDNYKAYFEAYVPKEIGDKINLEQLYTPVLFMEIEKITLEMIKKAEQTTYATLTTPEIAKLIDVEVGHPLIVVKRIYKTKRDMVHEVAITYFPGDKYNVKINLERIEN